MIDELKYDESAATFIVFNHILECYIHSFTSKKIANFGHPISGKDNIDVIMVVRITRHNNFNPVIIA